MGVFASFTCDGCGATHDGRVPDHMMHAFVIAAHVPTGWSLTDAPEGQHTRAWCPQCCWRGNDRPIR